MSIDWGSVASAAGVGAVSGLNQFKADTKEKEQLNYDRQRNQVADQQKAELHSQSVKQNEFTLQGNARDQAAANRQQLLSDRLGMYQNFKTTGDIDRAASSYIDFANQDNQANPNFDQNHALSYVKNTDGSVKINIVDKNTGALVRTAKDSVGYDDFIAATYQQLDPTKSYETESSNKAALAKKQEEYSWEERKLGLQYGYDIGKQNNQNSNAMGLEGYKFGNTVQLEGMRQEGSNYRAELGQDGANYRAGIKGVGGAGGTGGGKNGASSAVVSGVQGAIGFAQQNAPMLSFLSNQPDLYNKTIAMMGIESAGNPNAFSGSSYGPMQINGKYAQGFAKQFNISGNPVTNTQANIQTGAALINHLSKKYGGDTTLIAAAYNAGEPAIDKAVASWQKAGQQGSWFDHLRLNPDARQQVYGHIVKYNQALGYLGAGGQPTNISPEQVNQNNAQQTENAKQQYRQGMSAQTTASINTTAKTMATELGLAKDGSSAAAIGALSGTQVDIAKFASANTKQERAAAFTNIYAQVDQLVRGSEVGMNMSPTQRKEYVQQRTANLIGANNKIEAGAWITNGRYPKQAAKPKEQSNLNSGEIDNVFDEINVGSTQAKAPAKEQAKSGSAFIPLRNPMQSDGALKAASRFEPPKTTEKPALAPAPKPAPKPKTQMEKNMEARAERKRIQADAVNKRVAAEKAQKAKEDDPKPAAKRPTMNTQQAQAMFGTSAVKASEELKRRLMQNKS